MMSLATALKAAQAQLAYWQRQAERAHHVDDRTRAAECAKFIRQCELVIAALERAGAPASRASG